MTDKPHPLLTPEQQIKFMKGRGVKFQLMNEADALMYLQGNNNYFRLRAYRHGFAKHVGGENDGRYVDLDFSMLADLATIDMHLRYELLEICLEVEHFSKVLLLKRAEEAGEDGYSMVADYLASKDMDGDACTACNPVVAEIDRGKNGPYTNNLIEHYRSSGYPIWAFLELIPFGRFNEFWLYCASRWGNKDMKRGFYLLQAVKGARNACGHNSCIVNELGAGKPKHPAGYEVRRALGDIGISQKAAKTKLSNDRIIHLTSALYLHQKIASEGTKRAHARQLRELLDRMQRHEDWYSKNTQISSFFAYMVKLVDGWYPSDEGED